MTDPVVVQTRQERGESVKDAAARAVREALARYGTQVSALYSVVDAVDAATTAAVSVALTEAERRVREALTPGVTEQNIGVEMALSALAELRSEWTQ